MWLSGSFGLWLIWIVLLEGSPTTHKRMIQLRRDKRDVDLLVECDVRCSPYDQITDYDVLLEYDDEEEHETGPLFSIYNQKHCAFPCKIVNVNKSVGADYSSEEEFTIVSVEELPEENGFEGSTSNYQSIRPTVGHRKSVIFSSAVYNNLTKENEFQDNTLELFSNKETQSEIASNSECLCAKNSTQYLHNATTLFTLKPLNENNFQNISSSQNSSSLLLSKLKPNDLKDNSSNHQNVTQPIIYSNTNETATQKQPVSMIPVIPKVIRLTVLEAEMGEAGVKIQPSYNKTQIESDNAQKPPLSLILNNFLENYTKSTTEAINDPLGSFGFVSKQQNADKYFNSHTYTTSLLTPNAIQNLKEISKSNNLPSHNPTTSNLNFESNVSMSFAPFRGNITQENTFQAPAELNKVETYDKNLTTHAPFFSQTTHSDQVSLRSPQREDTLKLIDEHNTIRDFQNNTTIVSTTSYDISGQRTEEYLESSSRYSDILLNSTSTERVASDSLTVGIAKSNINFKNDAIKTAFNHSDTSENQLVQSNEGLAADKKTSSENRTNQEGLTIRKTDCSSINNTDEWCKSFRHSNVSILDTSIENTDTSTKNSTNRKGSTVYSPENNSKNSSYTIEVKNDSTEIFSGNHTTENLHVTLETSPSQTIIHNNHSKISKEELSTPQTIEHPFNETEFEDDLHKNLPVKVYDNKHAHIGEPLSLQTHKKEFTDDLNKNVKNSTTSGGTTISEKSTTLSGKNQNNTDKEILSLPPKSGANLTNYSTIDKQDTSQNILLGSQVLDHFSNTTNNSSRKTNKFENTDTLLLNSHEYNASKGTILNEYNNPESTLWLHNNNHTWDYLNDFHVPSLLPQHLQDSNETLGPLYSTDLLLNNISRDQFTNNQTGKGNQTTPLHKILLP